MRPKLTETFPGWIRADEVMRLTDFSRPTLYRKMRQRKFPEPRFYKGVSFWDRRAVESWIKEFGRPPLRGIYAPPRKRREFDLA